MGAPLHEAVPMRGTSIQKSKNKPAKIDGAGILVFAAIAGFIALLTSSPVHPNLA